MAKPSAKSLKNLRPWKKGQSGNPKGPGPVGGMTRFMAGLYARKHLTCTILRKIIKDPKGDPRQQQAALHILQGREYADVADYEPFLEGEKTLTRLRESGVDTMVIKKVVNKPTEHGRERALEFHDRSREATNLIFDRCEGKPAQAVRVELEQPTAIEIITPLTRAKRVQ